MFKFFTNISITLWILGIILFISSFIVNVSIWFGIEIIKAGGYLFILGLFFQLIEHDFSKRKVKGEAR